MTIALLSFNNYYNRLVKRLETYSDYTNSYPSVVFYGVNFNPNNNVTTSLVIDWDKSINSFDPDYLLAQDENTGSFTRWFIIDMVRNRLGQYQITLKRDLLSDFYAQINSSVCFIDKGLIGSENALIFNSEGISVNQIKKKEYLLKDKTKCGWIIGYVAPNLAAEEDKQISVTYPQPSVPDIDTFGLDEYLNKELKAYLDTETSYFGVKQFQDRISYPVKRFLNNTGTKSGPLTDVFLNWPSGTLLAISNANLNLADVSLSIPSSIFQTVLNDYVVQDDIEELFSLENTVFKDGDVYKILRKEIVTTDVNYYDFNAKESEYPNIVQAVENALVNAGFFVTTSGTGATEKVVPMRLYYNTYRFYFEELGTPITEANVTFKSTNKLLTDAPYKMFAIPFSDSVKFRFGENVVSINKEHSLQLASSIGTQLKTGTDGFLYDIQMLPYCPMQEDFNYNAEDNTLSYIGSRTLDTDYSEITNPSGTIGYLFWCSKSSFSFNILDIPRDLFPSLNVNDPIEFKTGYISTMTRLVSPNYSSSEQFDIFMNYGVNYFNVDCTYKPITPYIKVNINYKGLYGRDFNDNRGLTLGGDYSLPIVSDAWANYQIQNKNYANIFDRETQHLETKFGWGLAGSITGAVAGGISGAMLGGLSGISHGAVLGGVGGGVTGALDVIKGAVLHGESMDYRKDMYNFNLQNIQALPQGLVKTSAINYNSKIFPFVEIYDCTEEEKEMIRNKLRYNGMNLSTIGKISDFIQQGVLTYIQGKMIRCLDIQEDSHILNEINKELSIGVYYE